MKRFLGETAGNVAMITALVAPVLLGAAALSVDYAVVNNQRSALQQAADVAALASVKELSLSGASEALIQQVGTSYAITAFPDGQAISNGSEVLSVNVEPSRADQQVTVNLSYKWHPFLAHVFDYKVNPIVVSATAGLAGDSLTCIIGLMQPQPGRKAPKSSIHLDNNSVVSADGCAVFSNSTSRYGLRADDASQMSASTICSAGGVFQPGGGSTYKFTPEPLTDCPKIDDPLASRQKPNVGSCDFTNLEISTDEALRPGVYCGGITMNGNADVKLEPGVYTMKDGPLVVADTVSLSGTGITFFLTGADSVFDFQVDTSIDLSAAEVGSTAGLLFFEDRSVPYSFSFDPYDLNNIPADVRIHKISSNDARNLLGTIYLPRSILLVDAEAPVADASAYTAIITGRLWLREGPILTLNADLTDTTVPVPDGLISVEPRLVH